jgi:hypothetical protein
MVCPSCGAVAADEARFCASCGTALRGEPGARPAGAPARAGRPEAPAPGMMCPGCRQHTVPIPYFARGANIAKAVVLAPFFTPIASLVFFLLFKDKFLCTWCRSVLPIEAPVGLLEAFSPNVTMLPPGSEALVPYGGPGGGGPAALAASQDSHEIARLERKGRQGRFRAWALGTMTAGLVTLGGLAAGAGGEEAAAVFFSMGGLGGVGAFVAEARGRGHRRLAQEKRKRQETLRILQLARENGGRLTVTLVATRLHMDFKEAEAALDALVDGRRVDIRTDDEGRVTYVFPEIL